MKVPNFTFCSSTPRFIAKIAELKKPSIGDRGAPSRRQSVAGITQFQNGETKTIEAIRCMTWRALVAGVRLRDWCAR